VATETTTMPTTAAEKTTTTDPWALYFYAFKAPATFIDLRENGSGNNLLSISLFIQSS
jgi:hypothetical protein